MRLPEKTNSLDLAFGGNMEKLLPPRKEIPEEFWSNNTKWNKIVSNAFFRGGKFTKVVPKDGIDANEALAHFCAILRSFEPKHEHKEAACAYLLSIWFEEIEFEAGTPEWMKKLEIKE